MDSTTAKLKLTFRIIANICGLPQGGHFQTSKSQAQNVLHILPIKKTINGINGKRSPLTLLLWLLQSIILLQGILQVSSQQEIKGKVYFSYPPYKQLVCLVQYHTM